MLPEWMDSHLAKTLATIIPSAALGTLWRAVMSPAENIVKMAKGAFVAVTVGSIMGGAVMQYMQIDGFIAGAVIAAVAYLADPILAHLDHRGKKLRQGKIDISIKGDDAP